MEIVVYVVVAVLMIACGFIPRLVKKLDQMQRRAAIRDGLVQGAKDARYEREEAMKIIRRHERTGKWS